MSMKAINQWIRCGVAGVLLLGSLSAAASASAYERALKKAGRKPVVMFCYGANYDKYSQEIYKTFVKERKIMPAVRGTVFLEMPIYQLPNEREKKEIKKTLGGRSFPGGVWSVPCLAIIDAGGNIRGIIQDGETMADAEKAGAALKELLKLFNEQEKLLAKADSASPKRRASLLAQAADVNLRLPANLHSARNKRNNEEMTNDNGIKQRLSFGPEQNMAIVQALQVMDPVAANRYIRNYMASGCYSPRQRQEMMAAYTGHLRRSKVPVERLRAAYIEMRNIDPKSIYGAYAEGAIELWCDPKNTQEADVPSFLKGKTAMGNESIKDPEDGGKEEGGKEGEAP